MKAMVLAAGLGTRLRPLTSDRPKALVEIGGRTLLEITLSRLRRFGVQEVIVNTHHFGEMITEYLQAKANFGMRIEISREPVLLDTGGGLKKAAWFFRQNAGNSAEPFLVHNVDVISSIDLGRMLRYHEDSRALATLAVQNRTSSRQLLFDGGLQLSGRAVANQAPEMVRNAEDVRALAFSGIHVISPCLFAKISEEGVFPIVPVYLRLSAEGEKIRGYAADEYYWRDLGKPEDIAQATLDLEQGVVSV
jgi:NDP-sugar pyrophosphorylase family protein